MNAVSAPFGIFCCFPFTSICDSISFYSRVQAFKHVIDCFVWEPSIHYFTSLHSFGIGEVVLD